MWRNDGTNPTIGGPVDHGGDPRMAQARASNRLLPTHAGVVGVLGGRGVDMGLDSPCVAVCTTLFENTCRGCRRTAHEVAHWVELTDEQRAAVWQRIRQEMKHDESR